MRLLHLVMDAKWLGRVVVQSVTAPGSAQQECKISAKPGR